jgi:hypothetical protein
MSVSVSPGLKPGVKEKSIKWALAQNIYKALIFLNSSHKTIPALTEILNECLVPYCGISIA